MAENTDLNRESEGQTPAGEAPSTVAGRRRLLKAGVVAVPTVLTLRAKPAFAAGTNPATKYPK